MKEKNSDTVKYPYYCTIKIRGEIIEQNNDIKWNNVNYTLNWVNGINGSIKWNVPVNMTWLKLNFMDIFYTYWTDTDYTISKVE